mmetsp:Transcript_36847/g.74460  ORF Transcript_36847/g.74460 Transcript_36847/m.74460 type:complete len:208 (+) Transcript_36847:250-873(+)
MVLLENKGHTPLLLLARTVPSRSREFPMNSQQRTIRMLHSTQGWYFLKTSEQAVPPIPKLEVTATFKSCTVALLPLTKLRSNPSAGVSSPTVPGTTPASSAWQHTAASSPAAPAREFPICGLIDDTLTLMACSPNAFLIPSASVLSLSLSPSPVAATNPTSSGLTPAALSPFPIAEATASAVGMLLRPISSSPRSTPNARPTAASSQ